MELDMSEHALSVLITGFTEAQDAARRQREAILADVERATRSGRVPRHDHSRTDGADMSDSETLRAAAEVMRKRGWTATPTCLVEVAGHIDAENDAAKRKATERDQHLALVAEEAYSAAKANPGCDWWLEVARAVREAIEAEQ
jgi:hypothetical protein